MTKHETKEYFIIIGLCFGLVAGLYQLTRHTDSLAKVYNINSHKHVKNDLKKGK